MHRDSASDNQDKTNAIRSSKSKNTTKPIAQSPVEKAVDQVVGKIERVSVNELSKLKTHTPSDDFGFLPSELTGDRLKALQRSIETHGQLQPILADEQGNVIDGRARLRILSKLGKDVLVVRIKSSDLTKAILASLTQREMTVPDEVNLIKWVKAKGLSSMPLMEGKNATTGRDAISLWLEINLGWKRRCAPRTIGSYLNLLKKLVNANEDQKKQVAEANTVTDALKAFKRSAPVKCLSVVKRLGFFLTKLDKFLAEINPAQNHTLHCNLQALQAQAQNVMRAVKGDPNPRTTK